MRQWLMIMLLIACLLLVTGAQAGAGKTTFDLGDGYQASFELPDTGNSYELDYAFEDKVAKNEIMKYNEYGFLISSKGSDLATLTMKVYSYSQIEYLPKAHTEPSFAPETVGPRIIIPKTIGGSPGYVGYDLPASGTGTDISKAIGCFFKYYPGAWEELGDVKGMFEVYGETSGLPSSAESMKVVTSLMDSIKITGPGIK